MNGFLGYPSTFMLDVVVCALLLVVPTLGYSLYLVKARRNYLAHRNIQTLLGAVLLVTVALFEVDIRVHGGWKQIVNGDSPRLTADQFRLVTNVLYVHLFFAISTVFLWGATLVAAWRKFPSPPTPAPHSRWHKTLGWLAAIDITMTSVTGLVFYYLAFMV
jgi:putative membrane protein